MADIGDQLRQYGEAIEEALLNRPDPAPAHERARPRRRLLLAAASIAAVAVIAVGVVIANSGDDTTRVEEIVDTPTEPTLADAPEPEPSVGVFSSATDSVLLFTDGIDGATAIDLDHRLAGRRVVEGERAGDQPVRLALTEDHLVVGWGEIYAAPLDGGASLKIADATTYLPAAEPGEVWTLTWDVGRSGALSQTLERVRIDGTVVYSSADFGQQDFNPVLGVPGGVMVDTPEGVAVWDASSDSLREVLGPGPVTSVSSDGQSLAWCLSTCSDTRVAELEVKGAPPSRHVAGSFQKIALSPDGRQLAILRPDGDAADLVVVDQSTSESASVATGLNPYGAVQWDSDGEQLFYTESSYLQDTMRVGRYDVTAGTWELTTLEVGGGLGAIVVDRDEARSFFADERVDKADCPAPDIYPSRRDGVCTFSIESHLLSAEALETTPEGSGAPGVALQSISARMGPVGIERVVLDFDSPLPSAPIEHVDELDDASAVAISYTTQHSDNDGNLWICGNRHFGFTPGPVWTVDLLFPARWFADPSKEFTDPTLPAGPGGEEYFDRLSKIIVCPASSDDEFVQVSVTHPASTKADDVSITVEDHAVIVEVEPVPEAGSDAPAIARDELEALVLDFIDDLRRGDFEAAAAKWTGYPDASPSDPVEDRVAAVEDLLADPTFSSLLDVDLEVFVNASWSWTDPAPVVTVFSKGDGDDAAAAGFLVGHSVGPLGEQGEPAQLWIHRIPSYTDRFDPIPSVVEPGAEIVLPFVPVEGSARAYVNETEIPVTVDHGDNSTTITIPETVRGTVAVTVSSATPELSAVDTFAVTVAEP